MLVTQEEDEDVESAVLLDPRDTVRAELPEPQVPVMQCHVSRSSVYRGTIDIGRGRRDRLTLRVHGRCLAKARKQPNAAPPSRSHVKHCGNAGSPTGRESYGDGAIVVVRAEESSVHGEGWQVATRDRQNRYARCELPKCTSHATS